MLSLLFTAYMSEVNKNTAVRRQVGVIGDQIVGNLGDLTRMRERSM